MGQSHFLGYPGAFAEAASPYPFYLVFHLLGLTLLLLALGGIIITALGSAEKSKQRYRQVLLIAHGSGALLMLITGFGMIARLGMHTGIAGWVWGKIAIWVIIGIIPAFMLRYTRFVWHFTALSLLLIAVALLLVFLKPF